MRYLTLLTNCELSRPLWPAEKSNQQTTCATLTTRASWKGLEKREQRDCVSRASKKTLLLIQLTLHPPPALRNLYKKDALRSLDRRTGHSLAPSRDPSIPRVTGAMERLHRSFADPSLAPARLTHAVIGHRHASNACCLLAHGLAMGVRRRRKGHGRWQYRSCSSIVHARPSFPQRSRK